MPTRKRKNAKSEQNTKAKPVKLSKDKSTVVSNGVPLWQKLLGFLLICAAGVAAAVVLGVISIDDIKAIENRFVTSKREFVEEPVLGDDASPTSGSFGSDEAESNKSKLKEKEKITPEVVPEEDDQPQSINKDGTEAGDKDEDISPLEMEIIVSENDDEGSESLVDEAEIEVTNSQDEETLPPKKEVEIVDEESPLSVDETEVEGTDDQDEETLTLEEETENGDAVDEGEVEVTGGQGEETLPPKEETDSLDEESPPSVDEAEVEGTDLQGEETLPQEEETENVDDESAPSVNGMEIEVTDLQDEEALPQGKETENVDRLPPSADETEGEVTDDQDEAPLLQQEETEGVLEELAPSADEVEIEDTDGQDEEASQELETGNEDVESDPSVDGSEEVTDGQDEETSPPPKEDTEIPDEESVQSLEEAKTNDSVGKDGETPSATEEERVSVNVESASTMDETKTDGTDAADKEIGTLPEKETERVDVESIPSVIDGKPDNDDHQDEVVTAPLQGEAESVHEESDPTVDKAESTDVQDEERSPQEVEVESLDEQSASTLDETEGDSTDDEDEKISPPPKKETESVGEQSAPSKDEAEPEGTDGKIEETLLKEEQTENTNEEFIPSVDEIKTDETVAKDEGTSPPPEKETESMNEESDHSVDETEADFSVATEDISPPQKEETETVDEESTPFVDETKTEGTDDIIEQNLRGDLAGSDVKETIKTEDAESVKEEPVKSKEAEEENSDPLMNDADLKLAKEIQRADKLLQQKKTEQALRKFESLLKQHPGSPRIRYGRAQALDQMAEEKRSNDILKSSIDAYGEVAQGSDCPDELKKLALRRQAERMSFMGQTRSSVTVLNGLMKDFPSDIQIKKELGVQYLIMGADAKAKPFFEQILKLDPDDGFAKVHLGFILKREGLFEEAIVLLREGIESNEEGTSDGKYFFHLGDAYHRTGHPEEANSIYALGARKGLFRSAMQRSLYNVDTLHGQPWWTPKEAKFEAAVQQLEAKWQVILKEGLALMDKETQLFQSEDESLRDTGDWKQFMLYFRGKKDTKNCARAPETCKIIDSIPQSAGCKRGQVKFSVMHPGTHVWPHTGPTNCRLRSHLGLVIPEGTRIRVVNETRTWEEGKVLIFDDSFEHEVWQEADSFRLVLIVDLWHPGLTEQQKRYLSPI